MPDIIHTTLLEYAKSAFLLELIKHPKGKLFVEVVQTIHEQEHYKQSIKINPDAIPDIIRILQEYQHKIPKRKVRTLALDIQKIKRYYLKGVSIKDLAMQNACSIKTIENMLRNQGLEIVTSKPKRRRRYWNRKRKSKK